MNKVLYDNSSYGYLEPGDVILEIDSVKIFNNQTVSVKLNPTSKHRYRHAKADLPPVPLQHVFAHVLFSNSYE